MTDRRVAAAAAFTVVPACGHAGTAGAAEIPEVFTVIHKVQGFSLMGLWAVGKSRRASSNE